MTKSLTIKDLLDAKLAMDEADKLRLGDLRRKAGEHIPTGSHGGLGMTYPGKIWTLPADIRTHTSSLIDSYFVHHEPPKDWTLELEMVQHALVSRDRALVHIPRASRGWSLHTALERAFEARFGNSAYVNHGFPVNWPGGNCVYVPIKLDHLVSLTLPRVVEQGTDTSGWPRVVVFAYADDEHFSVKDLP